jgi:DnaJ-domain-containing protein 1
MPTLLLGFVILVLALWATKQLGKADPRRLARGLRGFARALFDAHLDRRQSRGREDAQRNTASGQGRPPRSGKMTEEEAYQILGIEPGAGPEDIGRAHRSLMKKLHPDQGGSTYLAARVNEAKDVLLRRHR